MKTLEWKSLTESQKKAALTRPTQSSQASISEDVAAILAAVKARGDHALREFTTKWDRAEVSDLRVSKSEFEKATAQVSISVRSALVVASENIRKYHEAQSPQTLHLVPMSGVQLSRIVRPIETVGLYIPGGSAPLPSTVMMLGIPAQIAGCKSRILCTPPRADGSIDPHILVAAQIARVTEVYKCGGAQAIAAMAFGTESIPKVDKIFGPGNAWVTEAKLQASMDASGAPCDLPAGPSEALVLADDTANPEFVASDLLAQAEHDPRSQVVLVTTSRELLQNTQLEIQKQIENLPRKEIARAALENSLFILVTGKEDALTVVNAYAPEHLLIQTLDPGSYLEKINNAGSIFLGPWTPESVGDYASGTNHVLPTYGAAKSYSGLSLSSFQKHISVQELTPEGLIDLAPTVEALASAEGLEAHRKAITVRMKKLVEEF